MKELDKSIKEYVETSLMEEEGADFYARLPAAYEPRKTYFEHHKNAFQKTTNICIIRHDNGLSKAQQHLVDKGWHTRYAGEWFLPFSEYTGFYTEDEALLIQKKIEQCLK